MYTDWILKANENQTQKTLEEHVVELLSKQKMTVATAESCTGGLIAATLVNVPGASDVLNEGYITYSNEAKMRLVGVSWETLAQYGAVSAQTAKEMAEGAAKAAKADAALSADRDCRTRGRYRGKAGRSGIYRLFCKWKNSCKRMYF